MLYSLNGAEMKSIPQRRRADFNRWKDNLSEQEYDAVVDAINDYINGAGEVFNSSYIPGEDWTGTVHEPLYHTCQRSEQQAGWFFGLIVWMAVIDREDEWFFKPSDTDGDDVLGMTYFRKS